MSRVLSGEELERIRVANDQRRGERQRERIVCPGTLRMDSQFPVSTFGCDAEVRACHDVNFLSSAKCYGVRHKDVERRIREIEVGCTCRVILEITVQNNVRGVGGTNSPCQSDASGNSAEK